MTNIAPSVTAMLLLVLAGILGFAVAALLARSSQRIQRAQFDAELADRGKHDAEIAGQLAVAQGELKAEARAHETTRQELAEERRINGELDKTVQPLRTSLDELGKTVRESEAARLRSGTELQQQITQMGVKFGEATTGVQQEARRLSQALSRSERRGSWGEMQLKQVVKSSGMIENVHFVTQDHTATENGTLIPDMVIDLAGGRKVVVDAKVSLDAFLALEQEPDSQVMLAKHADAVSAHVDRLSRKEYWKRYDSPEFVILFLPSEGLLQAAMEVRPALLQNSFNKRIVLATPMTLMAVLRTISFAWQQAEVADRAKEIQKLGAQLYERLHKMAGNLDSLGRSIGKSVDNYNMTIGSLESRVLPTARKFQSMSTSGGDLPTLGAIEDAVRPLLAPELQGHTEAAEREPAEEAEPAEDTQPPERADGAEAIATVDVTDRWVEVHAPHACADAGQAESHADSRLSAPGAGQKPGLRTA